MLLNPRFGGVGMLGLNREDDLVVNRAVKFRVTRAITPILEELCEGELYSIGTGTLDRVIHRRRKGNVSRLIPPREFAPPTSWSRCVLSSSLTLLRNLLMPGDELRVLLEERRTVLFGIL